MDFPVVRDRINRFNIVDTLRSGRTSPKAIHKGNFKRIFALKLYS